MLGDGTAVGARTLEHYPGMTERELERIEAEANRRWTLDASMIVHRYGRLEPGEPIVLVATASQNRQAALDSCACLTDGRKTRAPIRKLQATQAGERWVYARDADDAAEAPGDGGTQPTRRTRG